MRQVRIWFFGAVLAGAALPLPLPKIAAGDNAQTVFNSIFGPRLKTVRATLSKKDDIALAEELLAATANVRKETALVALMCETAYDLTWRQADGYDVAVRAAGVLAETVPQKKAECREKVLAVRKLQYARTRGAQKRAVGEALIKVIVSVAEARLAAGQSGQAAQLYREARIVASALRRGDLAAVLLDKLKDCTARAQVERKVRDLKARLQKDASDTDALRALILLYVVELDNPAEAKKLLTDSADPTLQTYVPLAVMKLETVAPAACLELGAWYLGLSKQASMAAKPRMLVRAQGYYARAIEGGAATGAAQLSVKLAMIQIEKELVKLGHVAPGTLPVGKLVDLLQYANLKSPDIKGTVTRSGQAVALKPSSTDRKEGGSLPIPVVITGSYRVQFKVQWSAGYQGVHLSLPVGPDCQTGLGFGYSGIGFSNVKGHDWHSRSNPTFKQLPSKLEAGTPYSVDVQVVRSKDSISLAAAVNGRLYSKWTGSVSMDMKGPASGAERMLRLTGSRSGTTHVGGLKIIITSGQGQVITPEMMLAMETTAAKPIPSKQARIYVHAKRPWTPVGKVQAKEYYHVSAYRSYEWYWAPGKRCGAKGDAQGKYHLQGRIGDGKPFRIGADRTFHAAAAGLLQLGMSDQKPGDFADNDRYLSVYVSWAKQRLVTAPTRVSVSANSPWAPGGTVEEGKTYRVTCSESLAWRAGGLKVNADGSTKDGKFHLQARIAGGEPFRIGARRIFTAKVSGVLELGMSHFAERGPSAGETARATVEPWRIRLLTAPVRAEVSARTPWTPAALVEAGKIYRISVSSSRAWRVGGVSVGPGGTKDAGKFHLQARIAGGSPFAVGSRKVFTAAASGMLELGMSDFAAAGPSAGGTVRVGLEPSRTRPAPTPRSRPAPTTRRAAPSTAPTRSPTGNQISGQSDLLSGQPVPSQAETDFRRNYHVYAKSTRRVLRHARQSATAMLDFRIHPAPVLV